MQAIPMILCGAEKPCEELDPLKSACRSEITAAIVEACEHSDLKENAEYHTVREQRGFYEGRTKDIEIKSSNTQVINITKMPNSGCVVLGAMVIALNLDNDEEQTWRTIGDDKAGFKQNPASVSLPITHDPIGKEQDNIVAIKTLGGEVEYEVTKVEYL